MIKKITTLLLLFLLSGCFANENNQSNQEQNQSKIASTKTEKASLFTLKTIDGKEIHVDETEGGLKFKEFQDKVIFLVFFGHKCPPCLREIPELIELEKAQHEKLAIIAMEVQGLEQDQLQAFAKSKGINYPLMVADQNRPFLDFIIQKANWRGSIPFLLGFDRSGTVQVVHIGGITNAQFTKMYKVLSQESQPQSENNTTH